MQSLAQLEANAAARPNSIELQEKLASHYTQSGEWEKAVSAYQKLLALYPATARLFVNRIRLGATALTVASALILLATLLQPPLSDAQTNPQLFSTHVTAWQFVLAQILIALALPLWSTAAISIYKMLSYSQAHRPAFWAMVCSVIGVGFSMPTLGINAIVLPQIGRLYLESQQAALNVYFAIQPWMLALRLGGLLLLAGLTIFTVIIWRTSSFGKIAPVLYWLGWAVFALGGNELPQIALVVAGLLIATGGTTLARSVWVQAALQFETSPQP